MKVTFNAGNMLSVIDAARRLKADHNLYIMPTYNGLIIEHTKPPTWMRHVIVHPDGTYKNIRPYMPSNI